MSASSPIMAQPVPPPQAPWPDRVWIDGIGYPRIVWGHGKPTYQYNFGHPEVANQCLICGVLPEEHHQRGCEAEECPVCHIIRDECTHFWADSPPQASRLAELRAAYCAAQETVWRLDKTEGAAWAAYSNVEGTFTDLFPAWQSTHTALTQAEATLLSAQVAYKTAVQAESEAV